MLRGDERLTSILDASPVGVIILRDDGVQLWVNQYICGLLGTRAEDVIGKDATIYRPDPGALGELEKIFQRDGMARDVEMRAHRIDTGAEVWVSCQMDPVTFDGVSGRMCWLTDITAYKLAQREREQARARAEIAEAQLRAIAEALPVGVIVFDAQRNLTFWNERYCALTATEADAYRKAKTFRDVVAYVYDRFPHLREAMDWPEFLAFWENQLWGEGQTTMILDFEEPKMTSLQFVSRLPDGGSILVVVDINEQKKAENEALKAKQEAEDANRAKSTFLAAMSHEIRTPMNGVLGMTEVLEQSTLTEHQRMMTRTIRDSATALLTIIDDVLDFSKIEAGHLELEAVPLAIRPLLESTLGSVVATAESKLLDLTLQVDPSVPDAVIGDPVRLRQITLNLLGNALKFTETGGVSVSVQSEPHEASGVMLTISVADTGIGIAREKQEQLFTPFTQAETSTTRRFGGTGLGLSISLRLVELMGGTIGVESDVGEGARFWFSIPLEIAAMQSDAARFDVAGLSATIMTERAPLASMVTAILEQAGITVGEVEPEADPAGTSTIRILDDRMAALGDIVGPAVILVGSLAGREPRSSEPRQVLVSRPPYRDALLRAVAVAAGRLDPESRQAMQDDLAGTLDARMPDVESARAAGTLVLVAEDNVTNRLVVERQLALLGHACEMAEDGAVALRMWRSGGYGLLLTDCHMPNMDGYDLAREIRREERGTGRRQPIIALTANALSGEADRCFEAGMDDYLAKPVTLAELTRVLGRWMPAEGQPRTPVGALRRNASRASRSGEVTHSPVDKVLLAEILGADDPETFEMVSSAFRDSAEPIFADLRQAISARSVPPLKAAAHKAAGAAGSVAAMPLKDTLLRIEGISGTGDWPAIERLGGEAEVRFRELMAYLER